MRENSFDGGLILETRGLTKNCRALGAVSNVDLQAREGVHAYYGLQDLRDIARLRKTGSPLT